jgi:DeoR/GlpR family transcriptional regulator of sugar metabolism
MFTKERQQKLVKLLERRRRLSNGQLGRALGVSPATLRRDLAELEDARLLVRFHGGAAHPAYLRGEPSFDEKARTFTAEKRAIGERAVAFAPPGATVFLDAGTTCLEVGRALLPRRDLTLVANSIAFAQIAREAAARVICLGGEVRGVSGALVGSLALSWLSHLRADVAFIGASGIDAEGASTTELSEAEVKQGLLARARRGVLCADASKWSAPSTVRFAAWSDLDAWITSADLPLAARTAVARASRGTKITIA